MRALQKPGDGIDNALLSRAFNKIHEGLSVVRTHLESEGDEEDIKILDGVELELLRRVRKIRAKYYIDF